MNNGPELWKIIHSKFADNFGKENVLIAGGCVRDYLVRKNKNPKDIDVFVNFGSEFKFDISMELMRRWRDWIWADFNVDQEGMRRAEIYVVENDGSKPIVNQDNPNNWLGQAETVVRVGVDDKESFYQVNIIGRTDVDARRPVDFVETFDLNVCKAWYDPITNSPIATIAAQDDLKNRTITYCLGDPPSTHTTAGQKILSRMNRIQRHLSTVKLPWSLVNAPESPLKNKHEVKTISSSITGMSGSLHEWERIFREDAKRAAERMLENVRAGGPRRLVGGMEPLVLGGQGRGDAN